MTYKTGADLANELNPGLKAALTKRYGHLLPGMSDTVVDMAFGQFYARPGLDLKCRYIATIAA
ncbi:hypothetical protein [Labrenzia sp. CE80]|uniref:hypothetical protein n=1 Tax=Labrenzia sp. CE80 TaxID=1788986 RepID=UPI00336A0C8C